MKLVPVLLCLLLLGCSGDKGEPTPVPATATPRVYRLDGVTIEARDWASFVNEAVRLVPTFCGSLVQPTDEGIVRLTLFAMQAAPPVPKSLLLGNPQTSPSDIADAAKVVRDRCR